MVADEDNVEAATVSADVVDFAASTPVPLNTRQGLSIYSYSPDATSKFSLEELQHIKKHDKQRWKCLPFEKVDVKILMLLAESKVDEKWAESVASKSRVAAESNVAMVSPAEKKKAADASVTSKNGRMNRR